MIPADIDPVALDQEIRTDLASSLTYVREVAGETLSCTDDQWDAALGHIRAHPVVPGLVARYYELVFALEAEPERAADMARGIVQHAHLVASQELVPFTPDGLNDDPDLYAHMIALGSPDLTFLAPSQQRWTQFAENTPIALDLIAQADPKLGAEVAALAKRICGASAPPEPARQFGSASSFMLWGAVVFNLKRENDVISLFERIVHETTHQLLFGVARVEPLVTNELSARYTSPLRRDPRPMDGIFHATFVCARVHYAISRLLDNVEMPAAQQELATSQRRAIAESFAHGRETVRTHGLLTPTGERMLTSAEDHMAAPV